MEDVLDGLKDDNQSLRSAAHKRNRSAATESSMEGGGYVEEEDTPHRQATGPDEQDEEYAESDVELQQASQSTTRPSSSPQSKVQQTSAQDESLLHVKTRLPASPTGPGYQFRSDDFPTLGNPKKISTVRKIQPQQVKHSAAMPPRKLTDEESTPGMHDRHDSIAPDVKKEPATTMKGTISSKPPQVQGAAQHKSPTRATVKPSRVPQPLKMPVKRQAVAADPPSSVDPDSPAQRLMREHYKRDLLAAHEAKKKAAEPPRFPSPPKQHDFPAFGTAREDDSGMPPGGSDQVPSPPSASKSSWARIASGPRGTLSMKPPGCAPKPAPSLTDSFAGWPTVPTYTKHWDVPYEDKSKSSLRGPHFAQPTQATTRRADQTVRRESSPVKPSLEISPTKSTKAKAPDFETEKRAAQRKRTSLPDGWMSPAQMPNSPTKSIEKIEETTLGTVSSSPRIETSSQPTSPRKKTSTYMSPTKATQQRSLATIGTESVRQASSRVKPVALPIDTSATMYGVDRPLPSSPDWAVACGRKNARPVFAPEERTQSMPPPSMRFPSPIRTAAPEPAERDTQSSSPDLNAIVPRVSLARPLAVIPNTLQTRRMSRTDMLRPIVGQLVRHDLFRTSSNTAIARTSERSGILGPALDRLELSQGLSDLSESRLAAAVQNVDQAMQQSSSDQQLSLEYLKLGIKRETRRRATLSRPRDVINEPIFNSPSGLRQLGSKAMSQSILRQIKLGCPEQRQQRIILRGLGYDPDETAAECSGGMRGQVSAQVGAEIQARIDQRRKERWARKNTKREEIERRMSERRTQSEVREPVGIPSPPEDPATTYHVQKPASDFGVSLADPATPGSLVSSNDRSSAASTLRATAAVFQPRSKLPLPWSKPDDAPPATKRPALPSNEKADDDVFIFKHPQPAPEKTMKEILGEKLYEDNAEHKYVWDLIERAVHEMLPDHLWKQIPAWAHFVIRQERIANDERKWQAVSSQVQSEQRENIPASTPTLSPDSNGTNTTTPPSQERDITGGRTWKIRGDTGFSPYSWSGRDGREISFRGYGPAAERNPYNPVTYHRDAATAPRQSPYGLSDFSYITPDAPKAMRLSYAKRKGYPLVPCNHVYNEYSNYSMLPYPGTCGICNRQPGLITGNVATQYPTYG